MATVEKFGLVRAGGWRTLESFWNSSAEGVFLQPAGSEIKVRYGTGWIFGKDGQKQKLDGLSEKILSVGGMATIAYARMQIKVSHDVEVGYRLILPGP